MMHFLRELFAKTAVKHFTVAYRCTVVCKRLENMNLAIMLLEPVQSIKLTVFP